MYIHVGEDPAMVEMKDCEVKEEKTSKEAKKDKEIKAPK